MCSVEDFQNDFFQLIRPQTITASQEQNNNQCATWETKVFINGMDYKTTGLETTDHVGCFRFTDRLIHWSRWPQHSGNL